MQRRAGLREQQPYPNHMLSPDHPDRLFDRALVCGGLQLVQESAQLEHSFRNEDEEKARRYGEETKTLARDLLSFVKVSFSDKELLNGGLLSAAANQAVRVFASYGTTRYRRTPLSFLGTIGQPAGLLRREAPGVGIHVGPDFDLVRVEFPYWNPLSTKKK